MLDRTEAAYFRRRILRWYKHNARQFPWRETTEPYPILLSEMLLQRTQAVQVAAQYESILNRFPTPKVLADASPLEVEAALATLGLRKRAKSLREMAIYLDKRHRGHVPRGLDDLLRIPGVGRYIAAATKCFAWGSRVPIVDANVVRLMERYFGLRSAGNRPRDDANLWNSATFLLPKRQARDYNRGILDFAAKVCTPRRPDCPNCPLRLRCSALAKLSTNQEEGP